MLILLCLASLSAYTVNEAATILNETGLLEYVGYDSCSYDNRDVLTASLLDLMLDKRNLPEHLQKRDNSNGTCYCTNHSIKNSIIGVVGLPLSTNSKYVSTVLSVDQIPVISYFATSVELSKKDIYPNFLRTILPDKFQAKLITEILLYYNWTYVSIIATDESYGRLGRAELHRTPSKYLRYVLR